MIFPHAQIDDGPFFLASLLHPQSNRPRRRTYSTQWAQRHQFLVHRRRRESRYFRKQLAGRDVGGVGVDRGRWTNTYSSLVSRLSTYIHKEAKTLSWNKV